MLASHQECLQEEKWPKLQPERLILAALIKLQATINSENLGK
jgi:hypothetical protein